MQKQKMHFCTFDDTKTHMQVFLYSHNQHEKYDIGYNTNTVSRQSTVFPVVSTAKRHVLCQQSCGQSCLAQEDGNKPTHALA